MAAWFKKARLPGASLVYTERVAKPPSWVHEVKGDKTVDEQYDAFAADYHWLYSDETLAGERFMAEHAPLLEAQGPRSTILDCACGIGAHAIGLARRGYRVFGADVSSAMVAEARRHAQEAGVAIPLAVCAWEELPKAFAEPFDLVICYGSSISHCKDEEQMVRCFCGMRDVLKRHGALLLHNRNWSRMRDERWRFMPLPPRIRDGKRCTPLYIWTWQERLEDPHTVEIVLIFEDEEGNVSCRSHVVTYYPFHAEDLLQRLESAGFGDIQTDFAEDKADYHVIARRP